MNWEAVIKFFELLNYITAGPVLAVVAILGLQQIRVSKETARQNFKRDAYKIAAEQCGYFGAKILTLYGKLQEELKEKNIKFFEKFDTVVDKNGFKSNIKKGESVVSKEVKVLNESKYLMELVNSIEGYSMYFVSGVADDSPGYHTTGKGYCEIVKELIPWLVHDMNDGYFKHTASLLIRWQNRIEIDKLRKQKREIEKELGKKQEIFINPLDIKE